MVNVATRSPPSARQAALNRFLALRRSICRPTLGLDWLQMTQSSPRAPWLTRNIFHSRRSASVAASKVKGTVRGLCPLAIALRTRMLGRPQSTRRSSRIKPREMQSVWSKARFRLPTCRATAMAGRNSVASSPHQGAETASPGIGLRSTAALRPTVWEAYTTMPSVASLHVGDRLPNWPTTAATGATGSAGPLERRRCSRRPTFGVMAPHFA
jgi:hypothetical protein